MLPKKEIVDRAFANGTMSRVNRMLSAAHILNIEANTPLSRTLPTLSQERD